MSVRDLGWRTAAVSVSLLLHLYLFLTWAERPLISARETNQLPNSLFVQIQFPQPQPEAQIPVEEPPPQEPVAKPEPPPKPKPKPKPKPEPKPLPKPKPKPVQQPVHRPPEPEQVAKTPAAESAPPPPPTASRENVDLRNEYLSRVLAKIEKNKFYPTIARRRNLQGMIRVRFRLGCDGKVEALEIEGKHSLLRKAASKAIQASLPLPKIPQEIECPMLIDYAMAYQLER
jgi:protein TonB